MSPNKLYNFFALLLVAATLIVACGTPATQTVEAPKPTEASQATEATAPTAEPIAAGNSDAVLTLPEQSMPTFTRNFNPFNSLPLPGTANVIHEPLMILNSAKGELVPWLATGYQWSEDLKTLSFTIRDSVLWSDGEPFTISPPHVG